MKKFFLLGVSMFVLAGCGGDSEEANGESEEGMGTLDSESEEEIESENDNSTESEEEANNEDSSHDSGLLDLNDTDPGWINYEGERTGSSEYQTTPPVEYDPSLQYEISVGAYIAYFNGDEFIDTVQQGSSGQIEQVEEADTIRVSYHNSFADRISLTEESN
ncbi:hypothetical protein SAMN05216216_1446 [Lacicoccus qingdaonensis]|uniref:Uncharacterized protein n=2 Tax=Lacicoccus qingdaonensis TaxID=576118 RepID=A0A1G9J845_9BACL|nr:hypothetical protein SAMN05216216_1446 [Salinicoccus qingdaonensis]